MLPARARMKVWSTGKSCAIPHGIAPRSSMTGTMDMRKTVRDFPIAVEVKAVNMGLFYINDMSVSIRRKKSLKYHH